jgi:hypothetical protein
MTTDPEIIKDLLPLYRSGLASPASRQAVEAWLADHAPQAMDDENGGGDSDSAALRALDEARRRARLVRWLFGLALGFTMLCFSTSIRLHGGVPVSAHLVAFDMPWLFAPVAVAAILCWILYFRFRRRLS